MSENNTKPCLSYWTMMNSCRNAYSSSTCILYRKREKSIIVAGKISMTMLLFSKILLLRIMPSMTDDTLRRIVTYIVAWIPGAINIISMWGVFGTGLKMLHNFLSIMRKRDRFTKNSCRPHINKNNYAKK